MWKSVGVEYISVEKYIDKIYNKDDTWLLCFGSAPKEYTWLPEGGYKNTEMFLEKLICTKETYGNRLKVGFIEYGRGVQSRRLSISTIAECKKPHQFVHWSRIELCTMYPNGIGNQRKLLVLSIDRSFRLTNKQSHTQ